MDPSPFLPSSGLFLTIPPPSARGLPAWGVSPASALPPPVPESPESRPPRSRPRAVPPVLPPPAAAWGSAWAAGAAASPLVSVLWATLLAVGSPCGKGTQGTDPVSPQDKRLRCQVTRGEEDTHGSAVTFPVPTQPLATAPPAALTLTRAPASPGSSVDHRTRLSPEFLTQAVEIGRAHV